MLAALDGAIADKKPIVVTLWHPHWAYAKYELKDLEDPKGTLGQAEQVNIWPVPASARTSPRSPRC